MLKDQLVRTDKDMMPLRTDAVGLHKSFEKVQRTEQAAQDLVRSWPQIRGALEDSATANKAAMDLKLHQNACQVIPQLSCFDTENKRFAICSLSNARY